MFIIILIKDIFWGGKNMFEKERLVVGVVVFLFFGLAVMPSLNAYKDKESCNNQLYDGNLSGYVFDPMYNQIEGALVRVYFHGIYEEDFSDEYGYYHVTNISICNCTKNVTASKEGYITEEVILSIYENTTYDFILKPIELIPDLDCEGDLAFGDVEPGSTLTGTITVENVGEPDSLLDWEIESYPEWGTWTFDPEYGEDLLSGETIDIGVEITTPSDPQCEFTGEVVIVNSNDSSDFCSVEISLPIKQYMISTNYDGYTPIQLVYLLINKLRYYKGIEYIESKDDILQIVENNADLSRIVEDLKSCECRCNVDSEINWNFPFLCTLMIPMLAISLGLYLITGFMILLHILGFIGMILNCYWSP